MDPKARPVPIHQILPQIADGQFSEAATDELTRLVADMQNDVQNRGGGTSKGSLTIKINLQLTGGVFDVTTNMSVKAPKAVFPRTMMFANDANGLVSEDPRQGKLPINVHKMSAEAVRKA